MESTHSIADKFKIRASACHEIMAGEIGLTEAEENKLSELTKRTKPLSKIMVRDLAKIKLKLANPELPTGAKTYCKKWLKETLYGRREEIRSKYITKGNEAEEEGFTVMATELNLGMVYKNTERKESEYFLGECDLSHNGKVYDNKSSWSLDTFPMFETELPDKKYWWQLQVYGDLWGVDDLVLCYTLNNSSETAIANDIKWEIDQNKKYKIAERMVFTKEYFDYIAGLYFPDASRDTFIEIPDEKRIKSFEFKKDNKAIISIIERVEMCRTYIKTLI